MLNWVGFVIQQLWFSFGKKNLRLCVSYCLSLNVLLRISINNVRINFYTGIYSTVHLIAASGVGVSGRAYLLSLFYSVELS